MKKAITKHPIRRLTNSSFSINLELARLNATVMNKKMTLPIIDKSLLNLFTILISGAGIFAIFLKYDVPELNTPFWDINPFAIKRDIIENVLTRIFIILALVGLLVQTISIIYGNVISERLYEASFYIKTFIAGIVVMIIVIYILGAVGKNIAKKKWLPKVIENQTKIYNVTGEIINNGGYRSNELPNIGTYSENQQKKEL